MKGAVEVLWEAKKLMVKALVEALVMLALVIFEVPIHSVVAVKFVEEAFSVYVVVATVRFPAKNPLPFTERSWPGVVVPMPTLPLPFITIFATLPSPNQIS